MTKQARRSYTVADFERLGKPSGFRYHLHQPVPLSAAEDICVAEGVVVERRLRPEFSLVASNLSVHRHYESVSSMAPQFSVIVLLAGHVHSRIGKHTRLSLTGRNAMTALYADDDHISTHHPAGQALRSINVSVLPPEASDEFDDQLNQRIHNAMRSHGTKLLRWKIPDNLLQSISHWLECGWDEPLLNLLSDGLASQLLAHALFSLGQPIREDANVSPRDRQLLERVREHLQTFPGEQHTLADLAKLACMSPSTLRAKFQTAYGCSIFKWLRQRRLEMACDLLQQGCNVQQVALSLGYNHASNFTTAFRQRYGVAPSHFA